jgi:hypothetical protein
VELYAPRVVGSGYCGMNQTKQEDWFEGYSGIGAGLVVYSVYVEYGIYTTGYSSVGLNSKF